MNLHHFEPTIRSNRVSVRIQTVADPSVNLPHKQIAGFRPSVPSAEHQRYAQCPQSKMMPPAHLKEPRALFRLPAALTLQRPRLRP
jgi:hypothetical protein